MKSKKHILIIIFTFTCISCSTSPAKSKSSSSSYSSKSKMPRVPAKVLPGGNGDNWRYLGLSYNGSFGVEINDSSINAVGNNKYSFQERKTIMDTNLYPYPPNSLRYTYSISNWQMNCNNKSYIINSTVLYDQLGKQIKEMPLYSDKEAQVKSGSIAWQEYNYICNGVGRNIGY
ncbi:MAG: hypothetical protein PHC75_03135 [Burkholderiales bacterium]|nr:hypothetical protein [Burkholderiales bacterium]